MKVAAPSLAPILRSDTQGRLLARVMDDPAQEYNLSELVSWAGSSAPTVQREIDRAEQAGIVTTRRVGPARVVRANVDHPLYSAVQRLILATYGPPAVIAREFAGIEGAQAVILFGSWAARYLGHPGRAPNDVDVLVLGIAGYEDVEDAAERSEQAIGLPVQATVRSTADWSAAREGFLLEVRSRPFWPVLVDDAAGELKDELSRSPAWFGQNT